MAVLDEPFAFDLVKGQTVCIGKMYTLFDLCLDADELGVDGTADEVAVEVVLIEGGALFGLFLPSAFLAQEQVRKLFIHSIIL